MSHLTSSLKGPINAFRRIMSCSLDVLGANNSFQMIQELWVEITWIMVHQRTINPIWERSHRFLWRAVIQVILRTKSSSSVIPIPEPGKCLLLQSRIPGWRGIRFLGSSIHSLESTDGIWFLWLNFQRGRVISQSGSVSTSAASPYLLTDSVII